jgi:hypothetical protein
MARPRRRPLVLALVLGSAFVAAAVAGHLDGLAVGLAYLGPAAFAVLLLLSGHFPGERRLLGRARTVVRRSGPPPLRPGPLGGGGLPRGGLLVASSLAGRAPPLLSLPL